MAEVGFSLTDDVSVVGSTATITIDSTAIGTAGNTFSSAIINQSATGILQIVGNGGTASVDLRSLNIADDATIQIVGFSADIILNAADLARYNASAFTIEAVDPFWTIQANSPQTPIFWMKGNTPSQFSGSGNSLVVTSSSPDNMSVSSSFSQFGSNNMPAWQLVDQELVFTNDGMLFSGNLKYQWAFILFSSIDSFGDILFGKTSESTPTMRLNSTGLSYADMSPQLVGVGGRNDVDSQITIKSQENPNNNNFPGADLSTGTPVLLVLNGGSSSAIDTFGIRGNNNDPSSFKIWSMIFYDAPLTDDEVSLVMADLAYEALGQGIATLDQTLGSDHEHYASRPLAIAGGGASAINSVSAPVTTVTLNGLIAGSRVYVENTTDSTVLYNEIEATTTFSDTIPANKNLLIRVRNASGTPKYKPFETTAVSSSDVTITVNQELDE